MLLADNMSYKIEHFEGAKNHRFFPTLPTIYEDSQYMKPSHDPDDALCPEEEQVEPKAWASGNHHMETDEEESGSLLDELSLPHERANQDKAASAPPATKPRTIEKKTEEVLEKEPQEKIQGICGARNSPYAP
jgi:hypothetical protein